MFFVPGGSEIVGNCKADVLVRFGTFVPSYWE